MSNRFFLIVGVVVGLSMITGHAQATLIGDTVELNRIFNGAQAHPSMSALVVAGPVEFTPSINQFFRVNVEASSIIIDTTGFTSPLTFGIGTSNILEISSLDWVGMSGFITGVDIVVNNIVLNQSPPVFTDRVTFDAHSISINIEGTQWGTSFAQPVGTLTINLQTSHIPEPLTATLGLLVIGAIGAVVRRRPA